MITAKELIDNHLENSEENVLDEASKYKVGVEVVFTKNATINLDSTTTITVPKDTDAEVKSMRGNILVLELNHGIKDSEGKRVSLVQLNKYDPRDRAFIRPTLGDRVRSAASKAKKIVSRN